VSSAQPCGSTPAELAPAGTLNGEHAAITAWRALDLGAFVCQRVEVLKQRTRASTYRLTGTGLPDGSLIAKRCRRSTGIVERLVYQTVLPNLAVPALRCYGFVDDVDGEACWLFLEDAGREAESGLSREDGPLVGDWLGSLQAAAVDLAQAIDLPERDLPFYWGQLRSIRRTLAQELVNPDLSRADIATLDAIAAQCRLLEALWHRLEDLCAEMPRTLVHGDFVSKNLRVRRQRDSRALLVFDWEVAGWGIPAADLVQFGAEWLRSGLDDLASALRVRWPDRSIRDLRRMGEIGWVFWLLTVVCAESRGVSCRGAGKALQNLRVYAAWMEQALRPIAREL
jgi:hypothetical protein